MILEIFIAVVAAQMARPCILATVEMIRTRGGYADDGSSLLSRWFSHVRMLY